jgi:hypothetical protein
MKAWDDKASVRLRCPACKQSDYVFAAYVTVAVALNADGTLAEEWPIAPAKIRLNHDRACTCVGCGYTASVQLFLVTERAGD